MGIGGRHIRQPQCLEDPHPTNKKMIQDKTAMVSALSVQVLAFGLRDELDIVNTEVLFAVVRADIVGAAVEGLYCAYYRWNVFVL